MVFFAHDSRQFEMLLIGFLRLNGKENLNSAAEVSEKRTGRTPRARPDGRNRFPGR